jgi:hypothetical protein
VIRRSDQCRVLLLGLAIVLMVCPYVIAQPSQDFFNGTVSSDLKAMTGRIDRIESMLTFAGGALIANFIATLVQIWRAPDRRKS